MKPSLSSRYEAWLSAHPDWDEQAEIAKLDRRLAQEELEFERAGLEQERRRREETELEDRRRLVRWEREREEQEEQTRRLARLQLSRPARGGYDYAPSQPIAGPSSHSYHSVSYPAVPTPHSYLSHQPQTSISRSPAVLQSVPKRAAPPPVLPIYPSHPQPTYSYVPPPSTSSSRPLSASLPSSSSSQTWGPPSLKPLFLPPSLIPAFLKCAAKQTRKKIECCGLLLGTLDAGRYMVRVLLVPRQTATQDTCETLEEERVVDFQEKRGLLTLGWVGPAFLQLPYL